MQNLDSRTVSMANPGALTGGLALPYAGLKVPSAAFAAAAAAYHPTMSQAAFEFHRAQLYTDYSVRFHLGMRAYPGHGLSPYHPNPHDPLSHPFFAAKYDPRARFVQEEPKPQQSYIGLIGMAILSSKDKKLVLSDIYQFILDNYAYFRSRGPGWRNSIRHNLSLNDCFIKSGRSANGKGHYWAIHPANVEDFKKGDFRRRKAQRRVRKAMGLAVPDDDESPSPPPPTSAETIEWRNKMMALEAEERLQQEQDKQHKGTSSSDEAADKDSILSPGSRVSPRSNPDTTHSPGRPMPPFAPNPSATTSRKRLFDVESLLAPDDAPTPSKRERVFSESESHLERSRDSDDDEYIDVDSKVDVENVDDVSEDNNIGCNHSGDFHDEQSDRPSSHEAAHRTPSPCRESPERRDEEKDSRSPINIPVAMVSREGSNGLRGPWMSPLSVGTSWPEHHPSAFHSAAAAAAANTVTAWSTVPHPGFPVMSAPYPMAIPAVPSGAVHSIPSATTSPGEALAAQQRWQETFSRIVARVCPEKNVKVEA